MARFLTGQECLNLASSNPVSARRKLRISLVVANTTCKEELEALNLLFKTSEYVFTGTISQRVRGKHANGLPPTLANRFQNKGYGLLLNLERSLSRARGTTFLLGRADRPQVENQKQVVARWEADKGILRYSEGDLEQIRNMQSDVAICATDVTVGPELISEFQLVLQARYGDKRLVRIGPPGFDEVLQASDETQLYIERLEGTSLNRIILTQGSFPTAETFVRNHSMSLLQATGLLRRVLLAPDCGQPAHKPRMESPWVTPPTLAVSLWSQLTYVAKTMRRQALKRAKRPGSWSVAYLFSSNWRTPELERSTPIQNPPGRYLADPFVFRHKSHYYCFVEDFDVKSGRGAISVVKILSSGASEPIPVLKEDFHLSYPFVFEHDGEIFMCPETHESGEIRLYRARNFPLSWERSETLIEGVSAVDTNIFFANNRWWIATNLALLPGLSHASELHMFSSAALLGGVWEPHPGNPVVSGPSAARNGGFFRDEDSIFRVFQVQKFGVYGHGFGVARIKTLTSSSYQEEVELEMSPRFFPKNRAAHSFSYRDGLIMVDYFQ